jgi:hypothetical protein
MTSSKDSAADNSCFVKVLIISIPHTGPNSVSCRVISS